MSKQLLERNERIYCTLRGWQDWEAGERRMHPAFWELWQLKATSAETCGALFPPGQFAVQACTLPKGHAGEHRNTVRGL